MKSMTKLSIAVALLLAASPLLASTDCELRYTLRSRSLFYKEAKGSGTVHCDNGQSVPVRITARGIGLSVGRSTIENGKGKFSEVAAMHELFGTYVQAEAHAGAVKSSEASVLTKGPVSLAIAGSGRGVGLGVDVSRVTITRR